MNPDRFFDRTYMTASLSDLASQVVRRLTGIQLETSAVFNMATQFGGGKTHSLTALYHLAKHGDEAKGWKGIEGILNRAGLKHDPKADIAVFVGTEFDVLKGRGGEMFQSAYPFHPAVLRVFEQKWQSLPRFQRTRGVLRMLALWVSHAYQEEHRKAAREPLITLGLAPLENPTFRDAIFEQLGSSELEIPVTTDIAGKSDAHGVRLDKEATDAIRLTQLHRKVATTILFESNGGMSQARADASGSKSLP